MTAPQIVWLRRDLRLRDQPAFHAAAGDGPVVPLFILDDRRPGRRKHGGAHRWWLHHSLTSLQASLAELGARLILREGDSVEVLAAIARQIGAAAIHANRHYEPWWREAEEQLHEALPNGCALHLHDGNYMLPPGTVKSGSGKPYKIYTPFSKAVLEQFPPRDELPAPDALTSLDMQLNSENLADWNLLPTKPDWATGFAKFWDVGEHVAVARLDEWQNDVVDYDDRRNCPSVVGSSRMSPHLHWGEISPVTIWHGLKDKRSHGWKVYEKELIWRDFAQNLICQFPSYADESYRDTFDSSLWRDVDNDDTAGNDLKAWQEGRTGYPIVDAGMRELWQVGWMHNRVRMITASFLIKHLLIDWRHGEQWFWDCLVDGDLGNNGTNWQWVAGTGVDSSMFPRIMAPLSQSRKFDAGDYIRRWVPELAHLPDDDIHDPKDKRPSDYPEKLIGHKAARERALHAYRQMKDS